MRPNDEQLVVMERTDYPPGVPCWIDLAEPDQDAAARFYGELFGWQLVNRMPAHLSSRYLVGQMWGRDVAAIAPPAEALGSTPAWRTYIAVESAGDAAARVREAGGQVLAGPVDAGDAGRSAVCADPAGAVFSLWQPGRTRGAQLVNIHGTWNWSNLDTRDIEGSRAFYGAVFGWKATTMDLGQGEVTMWHVPGYAESMERRDPGLRRRHADAGAPPGFSDSIGWMLRLTGEDAPHWGVTFAVDDTGAIASRAVELGGRVVQPPVDAGPVRLAVLRDPQGAVFTVNTYTPQQEPHPGPPPDGGGEVQVSI